MSSIPSPRSALLPWLVAALAAAVALCGLELARLPGGLRHLPLFDYTSFWAAGRLVLAGEDPYDPARLIVLERQADPHQGDTLVMWPAPWSLTALLPFSDADAHASHLRWLAFEFVLLLIGCYGAWRVYGGPPADVWRAGLVVFSFLPTYCVLVTGQMSLLVLLGFVGFLWFVERGQDGWSGASLVLAAIKPQLTLLFWAALLVWVVANRRWGVLLGGIAATAAGLAWPLGCDPHLLQQYWVAITQRTQTHSHLSPVVATGLRVLLGPDKFWLQFVPLVPGLAWLARYWRRHRRTWSWRERLPALLFASFVVAPYGAWPFDLVVLLLPLLQRAVGFEEQPPRAVWAVAGCYAAINLLMLGQLLAEVQYCWFIWPAPALALGWYANSGTDTNWSRKRTAGPEESEPTVNGN
jgi:hypothetical protein